MRSFFRNRRISLFVAASAALLAVPASTAAPAAGPSLTITPGHIQYGLGDVLLSGVVPSKRAGETVSVLSLPCRISEYAEIGTTTTVAGGRYRYRLQPMLNTRFRVRSGTATGPAVNVSVMPLVEVEKVGPGRYRVKVSTTNPVFQTGSRVQLQSSIGQGWVTVKTAALKKASPETAITVESAVTIAAAVKGTVRAVLPATQAKCYATGTSKPIKA